MLDHPSSLGKWLRRYSLPLIAALGSATGLAYAATRYGDAPLASSSVSVVAPPSEPALDPIQDTVQIAILLDTSGSMDGLIHQARSHLWNMVDEMGKMTRVVNGKTRGVRVELALYEYGHSTLPQEDGFIRQVLPLSTDLDKVSEELHQLVTNGGDEYVGQAIATAVKSLQWSADPAALKFVFVAGNEEFDQGPITAAAAMAAAKDKDIHVQLIHCGPSDSTWLAAASLAHSDLLTIDQDQVAQHVPAPQDAEILRLGTELNGTYMAYGPAGAAAQARQANADASSAKLSPKVAIERAQLKRKGSYRNENWDVVDAVNRDGDFLAKTADDKLPTELRGKSLEEKQAVVAAKTAARDATKAKLAKLEADRAKFLAAEHAKNAAPEQRLLSTEMMKSAKKVAGKKGYKF
ncbi:MAG: VWA domain-containing protein [Myxococcales bacterium]|nr:VWA domain-containing protein [Myxococcales bacterium]